MEDGIKSDRVVKGYFSADAPPRVEGQRKKLIITAQQHTQEKLAITISRSTLPVLDRFTAVTGAGTMELDRG